MQDHFRYRDQTSAAVGAKRVVIVDDSRTMRAWLRMALESDARLTVVGEADSADSARQLIKKVQPDVITLDIEMPGMNGLAFLERVMSLRPMPVVMISSATEANSDATITALSLGAMDCILKPTMGFPPDARREIARRVFSAACGKVQVMQPAASAPPTKRRILSSEGTPIILIGASTGGVTALEHVLADLPADSPPVVVVQHMPGAFLVSFCKKLARNLPQNVRLAEPGEVLAPGMIRIAPAQGRHTGVVLNKGQWQCDQRKAEPHARHCPSVDVLFKSAAPFGNRVVAVILTGLGRDGADGMHDLRQSGAATIGQDEETCAVYGMPRAAWELGAVEQQLSLNQIGGAAMTAAERLSRALKKGASL